MSRRTLRIVKTILRYTISTLGFAICGILIWRVFWSGDPKEVSTLLVNDRTAAAYAAHGDNWTAYNQSQQSLTRAEYEGEAGVDHKFLNKNNYGYFGVTQSVIIEEAKQVQLTFRYNNSTVKYLKNDYSLSEMPSLDDHLYDVTLLLAVDLTPDDDSDNLEDVLNPESVALIRVQPDKDMTIRTRKNLYNYYRLVFDLPEDIATAHILAIYVDVYYVGDIVYLEEDFDVYKDEPYGSLCIYEYISAENGKNRPYVLSKDEKEALLAAIGG